MGGFPEDEAKAFGVISIGSMTAALAGATKVIVKTPHEAHGIPSKEANASGIRTTKMTLSMYEGQKMPISKELEEEMSVIRKETECIISKVIDVGKGDIAQGTVKAIENGIIDIPFGPSIFNLGKMMPARDNQGAIRYLVPGNLPFTKDILDYNRKKLEERGKYEKRDVNFKMTIDDIYAVSRGKLIGRK
jgi:methylaspartate mutase epsilon subunit